MQSLIGCIEWDHRWTLLSWSFRSTTPSCPQMLVEVLLVFLHNFNPVHQFHRRKPSQIWIWLLRRGLVWLDFGLTHPQLTWSLPSPGLFQGCRPRGRCGERALGWHSVQIWKCIGAVGCWGEMWQALSIESPDRVLRCGLAQVLAPIPYGDAPLTLHSQSNRK